MADDHTSQAWGVYGSILDTLIQMPGIQRLADEGCLLTNAFCTNSICVPSRATILTGQYSHVNKVYTLGDSLNRTLETFPKLFSAHGYTTAIIGKWHLKTKPAGFDYYNVLPGQGRYHNPILRDSLTWSHGKEYKGFSADIITDLSIKWLQERPQDKPFVLMTHYKATHEPFDYPDRLKGLYDEIDIPAPESLLDFGTTTSGRTFSGQVLEILGQRYEKGNGYPGQSFSLKGLDSLQARKKIYEKFIRDFLRSAKSIDENIVRLLKFLDDNRLTENTVVIYTSDQGYFLGEHGFFDKRMMYEESMRMPFVVRYPKEIPSGSTLNNLVLNIDFAPLLLDYGNIKIPRTIQGESFRNLLISGHSTMWRKSIYYRYWMHQKQRPAHFGIRNERYKLIFFYGLPLDMSGADKEITPSGWEFYDLQNDPRELKNVYHDSSYFHIISRMKTEMKTLRKEVGDVDEKYPEIDNMAGW